MRGFLARKDLKDRGLKVVHHSAKKDKRTREEKEFAQFWKVRNEELSLAEEQEKQEAFNRQKELKKF